MCSILFKAQQASNTQKKSEKKSVKRGGEEENSEEFIDPQTPSGEKKRMSSQMAKQYNPAAVEKSYVLFIYLFFNLFLYEIDHNCFSIFSYYLFIYACWSRWYEWWEKSGFFVADAKSTKPSFVIVSLFLDFFKIVYGVIRAFFFVSVFCFHVTKKILNRKI